MPGNEKQVRLVWTGQGMRYDAYGEKGKPVTLDGGGSEGPGPMEALLLALAGCMAMDVQAILERSRVPLHSLEVEVTGERTPEHPRRYTRIGLSYRVGGPEEGHQAKLERAVALSRDKFCSVLHSLRTDIDFDIEIHRV